MPFFHPVIRDMRLYFAKDEAERQYWKGFHAGQDFILKRVALIFFLLVFVCLVILFAL